MARRKKSDPGLTVLVVAVALLGLLSLIPKQVWFWIVALAVLWVAYKVFGGGKTEPTLDDTRKPLEPHGSRASAKTLPESMRPTPLARTLVPASLPTQQLVPPSTSEHRPSLPPPLPLPSPPPTPAPAPAPMQRSQTNPDEPVSVALPPSPKQTTAFRVPPAPKGFGAGAWIPRGVPVEVAGTILPGGMLYVGTSLKTPDGGTNDPSLIDPSKGVALQGDYTRREMGYWPSYSDIPGTARRAYLNWLAGGRSDPAADIGYVFLFFYGLERRAILDAAKDAVARAEWPDIGTKLRRLLDVYGDTSASFRRYASELLDWVSLSELPCRHTADEAQYRDRVVPRAESHGRRGRRALKTAMGPLLMRVGSWLETGGCVLCC